MTRDIHPSSTPPVLFGAGLAPLATLEPGESAVVHTLDCYSNRITSPESRPSRIPETQINPLTGPIAVRGAQPGDALRVHIERVEPARDFAVTALVPHVGGLTVTERTAMLHDPLPERVRILPIEGDQIRFSERIRLPLTPFVGTIGTAPAVEAIHSLVPDRHGGNLDCPDVGPGHTLILPVQTEDALLSLGDAHATQGDGELTGVAAEMPARVHIRVELEPGNAPGWPRIESDTELMAIGAARPLEDAARIAWRELIDWLASDFGFDRLEAYQLLGQVGRMRLGNMVDPNYTMVARLEKRHLPA
ncbi:MAG: acetamidase/formamidase family protein [Phycisphaeraceae bacterium]